eukprot:GEMP01004103.1.p1 GENE.GEMP01004103.1~~GEMP01004103.1.p1  ORF type:complete len:1041 (+),score=203.27 GEMP01004103.1:36-3158(+)
MDAPFGPVRAQIGVDDATNGSSDDMADVSDEPWMQPITSQNIEAIWLQERNISEVSTSMISYCARAKILDLRQNMISCLPEGISALVHLEELLLESNQLKKLPKSIGSFSKMKALILNRNNLTTLPSTICNLASLQVLNVADNMIRQLPVELGKLRNLVAIYVHHNHFTVLPTSFSRLSKLKEISLEWFRYSAPPLPRLLRGDEWKAVLDKVRNLCHNRQPALEVPCLDVLAYISDRVFDVNGVDAKLQNRLHVACCEGHNGIVKSLSTAPNIKLDTLDVDGFSALLISVREEHHDICAYLVDARADVNSGGGLFGSSIHVAVVNFNSRVVDLLIQGRSDVNFTDGEGNTPLHVLQSVFDKGGRKSQYIGTRLISANADCNLTNVDRWGPIHLSARRGQLHGIEFICKHVLTPELRAAGETTLFDLDLTGGSHQWTALHLAGHACHSVVVQSLLDAKADAYRRNQDGKAARYVSRGNLTVSKILKKAEMEATWTRLHRHVTQSFPSSSAVGSTTAALRVSHVATTSTTSTADALEHTVRALNAKDDANALLGEFVRLVTTGGRAHAFFLLAFPKVLKMLMDTELIDTSGYCAIMYACAGGDEQLVRLLTSGMSREDLSKLGNLTTRDEYWTLLHLVCQPIADKTHDPRSSIISFLLSVDQGRGFSLNAADYRGQTPLHLAVQRGDLGLVQVLLQYHADANAKEMTAGWSALHFAVSKCDYTMVLQLLHHSETEVNLCDNFGWTPLFEASSLADSRDVSLLINAKADVSFVPDTELNAVAQDLLHSLSTSRKDETTKLWMCALLASNGYDCTQVFNNLNFSENDNQMLRREALLSTRENPSRGITAPMHFSVPFHLSPRCNACKVLFSGPIRKFPCRSCGLVFCNSCSKVMATQVCCVDQVITAGVTKLRSALSRRGQRDSEPAPEPEDLPRINHRTGSDAVVFTSDSSSPFISTTVGTPMTPTTSFTAANGMHLVQEHSAVSPTVKVEITPKPVRRPSSARNVRLCPSCTAFYRLAIGDTYDMLERVQGNEVDQFRKVRI